VVGSQQESSAGGVNAKHVEIAARHSLAAESLGALVEAGGGTHAGCSGERLERRHPRKITDVRDRQRDPRVDVGLLEPDSDETLSVGKGHLSEQRRADERGDGRRGASPEADAEDGGNTQGRGAPQAADGLCKRGVHERLGSLAALVETRQERRLCQGE